MAVTNAKRKTQTLCFYCKTIKQTKQTKQSIKMTNIFSKKLFEMTDFDKKNKDELVSAAFQSMTQEEKDSIVTLDLSMLALTKFPTELFQLRNLRSLDMGYNRMKKLPENIDELGSGKIETLSLYDNKIKEIPSRIGNMKHLVYLTFRNNQLTSIPNEVLNLTQCKKLFRNCAKSIAHKVSNFI